MDKDKIGILGLGYVGLPLAIEFSKITSTIGYDISPARVKEINSGIDKTLEISEDDLKEAIQSSNFSAVTNVDKLAECNFYIVTVPTPIDSSNKPDLRPLESASKSVGRVLKKGDIVVFESTVYPGATEEICVPILESVSGLSFNIDFYCGYSPERINPGDKVNTVSNIMKVTSGSTPESAKRVDELYQKIIKPGTFKATSIKVAEAAKVIENTQRDLNIAFVNELAIIFNKLEIDTRDVLEAASTKWNFLNFQPGLVGGHCIGVDPYYLTHKSEQIGYHPDIILSGRRLNDGMGQYIANQVVKLMIRNGINVNNSKAIILGITFKENCPDIRNSKVIDLINELEDFGVDIDVYDPWANSDDVNSQFNRKLISGNINKKIFDYDVAVYAVAHDEFKLLPSLKEKGPLVYDVKGQAKDWDDRL